MLLPANSSEAVRETLLRASFDLWRGGMRIMMEKHKQGGTKRRGGPGVVLGFLNPVLLAQKEQQETLPQQFILIKIMISSDGVYRLAFATSQSSWCCPFPSSVLFCTSAERAGCTVSARPKTKTTNCITKSRQTVNEIRKLVCQI